MTNISTDLIRQDDAPVRSTAKSLVALPATELGASESHDWLRSPRGVLVLATAFVGVGAVASGWYWLGFAAIAPFLYTLPCMAMMALCMKGMGSGESQSSGTTATHETNVNAQRQM
jgi:hypothetical protein